MEWAIESLTKKQKQSPSKAKKQENGYISKKVKSHHVDEDNDESDDEFTGKGIVYDSDEDDEALSDDHLTGAKKKVLKFFNEATDHELTGIQGCNKKKVQEIIKQRPFEGWVDLVTKFQTTKYIVLLFQS